MPLGTAGGSAVPEALSSDKCPKAAGGSPTPLPGLCDLALLRGDWLLTLRKTAVVLPPNLIP